MQHNHFGLYLHSVSLPLFTSLGLFVWSVVVDLLIAQWMRINNLRTKVLLLFKLIHIMDDHKLETIQQTEVKRRMPSACCYLAQDSFFFFSPSRHSLVSCQTRKREEEMVIGLPDGSTKRFHFETLNLQILNLNFPQHQWSSMITDHRWSSLMFYIPFLFVVNST